VAAWIDHARSVRALYFGDLGEYVQLKDAAASAFAQAGDRRNACGQRARLGYGLLQVGAFLEARACCARCCRRPRGWASRQLVASV
jgi:hypothetical protein